MSSLKSGTIKIATILQALCDLEGQGIDWPTTPQIGEMLLRPQNYDMGGRMYGLTKATQQYVEKKENPDAGHNLYRITDKGREFLSRNMAEVQIYGNYELIGSDKKVTKKASGVALDAFAELQGIIGKNVETKAFIESLFNQIDAFLEEQKT